MIYNPFIRETFFAIQGEGAYMNDRRIHVNDTKALQSSLIAVGTSPYHKEMAPEIFGKIEKVFGKSLDIRRTGSAALDLAYVACGRQDAYFEYSLKPWDYAAGVVIISEAGGIVRSIGNTAISYEKPSDIIACCNERLYAELSEWIK